MLRLCTITGLNDSMLTGGFCTDSQDMDDASVSSAVEGEEEPSSPASGRGGSLASSLKRRGLPTPPATPGGSRGGESNTAIFPCNAFVPEKSVLTSKFAYSGNNANRRTIAVKMQWFVPHFSCPYIEIVLIQSVLMSKLL